MKKITIESIRNGLATKDSWVERAVLVLADDPAVGVLDRRHFSQYRDDLNSFGKIDPIEPARDPGPLPIEFPNLFITSAHVGFFFFNLALNRDFRVNSQNDHNFR